MDPEEAKLTTSEVTLEFHSIIPEEQQQFRSMSFNPYRTLIGNIKKDLLGERFTDIYLFFRKRVRPNLFYIYSALYNSYDMDTTDDMEEILVNYISNYHYSDGTQVELYNDARKYPIEYSNLYISSRLRNLLEQDREIFVDVILGYSDYIIDTSCYPLVVKPIKECSLGRKRVMVNELLLINSFPNEDFREVLKVYYMIKNTSVDEKYYDKTHTTPLPPDAAPTSTILSTHYILQIKGNYKNLTFIDILYEKTKNTEKYYLIEFVRHQVTKTKSYGKYVKQNVDKTRYLLSIPKEEGDLSKLIIYTKNFIFLLYENGNVYGINLTILRKSNDIILFIDEINSTLYEIVNKHLEFTTRDLFVSPTQNGIVSTMLYCEFLKGTIDVFRQNDFFQPYDEEDKRICIKTPFTWYLLLYNITKFFEVGGEEDEEGDEGDEGDEGGGGGVGVGGGGGTGGGEEDDGGAGPQDGFLFLVSTKEKYEKTKLVGKKSSCSYSDRPIYYDEEAHRMLKNESIGYDGMQKKVCTGKKSIIKFTEARDTLCCYANIVHKPKDTSSKCQKPINTIRSQNIISTFLNNNFDKCDIYDYNKNYSIIINFQPSEIHKSFLYAIFGAATFIKTRQDPGDLSIDNLNESIRKEIDKVILLLNIHQFMQLNDGKLISQFANKDVIAKRDVIANRDVIASSTYSTLISSVRVKYSMNSMNSTYFTRISDVIVRYTLPRPKAKELVDLTLSD